MQNLNTLAEKTVAMSLAFVQSGQAGRARELQKSLYALRAACLPICKRNIYGWTDWNVLQNKIGLFPAPEIEAAYNSHIALINKYDTTQV